MPTFCAKVFSIRTILCCWPLKFAALIEFFQSLMVPLFLPTATQSFSPSPSPLYTDQSHRMDLTEGEITRLYRVRKTLMQMVKDWDYIIVDHDLNMTMSQFKNKYGENMKRDDL
ncbi:putative RNA polymerase, Rpb5 [Rosa chinensis]|uniref:Putative RNA polymerase, Rpb5 n=1 Tax=Rosa chinensis TaxID=74649 RepID=A0A2P6SEX9_ROSCH|nr:putative RNA polymerase, Rpb5 [Rosa chinensis]